MTSLIYYAVLFAEAKVKLTLEKLCEEAFSFEDDGFPGDEDNGSMALWYVFSNIGIYPFCPGKKEFVRGADLVGTPLVSFSKILATANDDDVFNGDCGAESGWLPVSAIAPSVLLESIEVEKTAKSRNTTGKATTSLSVSFSPMQLLLTAVPMSAGAETKQVFAAQVNGALFLIGIQTAN